MKIDMHIERLILEGLPVTSVEVERLQRTLQHELARLLATSGLLPQLQHGATLPRVRAGNVQFGKAPHPAALGQSIARAVHESIGNSPKQGNPR
jgi:hypothetical protein